MEKQLLAVTYYTLEECIVGIFDSVDSIRKEFTDYREVKESSKYHLPEATDYYWVFESEGTLYTVEKFTMNTRDLDK